VTFCIFLFIHDTRRQRLFVGLTLENLLFYRARADETIHKAYNAALEKRRLEKRIRKTYILSFGHHARHEPMLADQQQDSNLFLEQASA